MSRPGVPPLHPFVPCLGTQGSPGGPGSAEVSYSGGSDSGLQQVNMEPGNAS